MAYWLSALYRHALQAFFDYFKGTPNVAARSAVKFKDWCDKSSSFSDVFVCDGYRLCRAAKLLMSLGYGNFSFEWAFTWCWINVFSWNTFNFW